MSLKRFDMQPHISPIGNLTHLGFRAMAPHLRLQNWVQCYWLAQADNLPAPGFKEMLYPDGGTTLTFCFTPGQLPQIRFEARLNLSSRVFTGTVNYLGVRFHPGGAYQLLGRQIGETLGLDIALHDLQLNDVAKLQEQLASHQYNAQRLTLIENWLLQQEQHFQAQAGIVQHLWPRLVQHSENLHTLIQPYSLSRRQIERKFQQQVGLSPAQIKLLHNVKAARKQIADNPQGALTNIGLDCGFYDQAHFIRQFRSVTQQTPGQYRARKMSQKYNSTQ